MSDKDIIRKDSRDAGQRAREFETQVRRETGRGNYRGRKHTVDAKTRREGTEPGDGGNQYKKAK